MTAADAGTAAESEALRRLLAENQSLRRELVKAREQQTATSEALRVIAVSPAAVDASLTAISRAAKRLCQAGWAIAMPADV